MAPFLRVRLALSVWFAVVLRCSMVHVGHFQHTFYWKGEGSHGREADHSQAVVFQRGTVQ
nr:MAG TPA: hypothetical protein [Caudoviricetes sp.]